MNKLLPALLGLGMIGSAWAADPVPADFLFRATGGGGSMRARSADAEKPANTTLCITPRRAHASIATMASGTIGI